MFVDELKTVVRGGRGGDGCASFRREKYVSRGGPDGGDGGDGGSVVLTATTHENTLHRLTGQRLYAAQKGRPGGSRGRTGRGGADLMLEVPVGTVVLDADRGNVLKDLRDDGQSFVVARGGRGGRGNTRFATATHRAPREFEEGRVGEERNIRLSLKLIADIGLVGLPNAGKSTLLSTLSEARPRIADYPFTTLEPCLGIAPAPDGGSLVIADIPGLIEGAHQGKGLGDKFLKHVERTRVLLHLVDCSSGADEDPVEACQVVLRELAAYSSALGQRPRLLVATKVEDDAARERARELAFGVGEAVHLVSAASGMGLGPLLAAVLPMIRGS